MSKFIVGRRKEKYRNKLKVNLCLSVEMFLCFPAALINQPVPVCGKGEQEPGAPEWESEGTGHPAHAFPALILLLFDSSFNQPPQELPSEVFASCRECCVLLVCLCATPHSGPH